MKRFCYRNDNLSICCQYTYTLLDYTCCNMQVLLEFNAVVRKIINICKFTVNWYAFIANQKKVYIEFMYIIGSYFRYKYFSCIWNGERARRNGRNIKSSRDVVSTDCSPENFVQSLIIEQTVSSLRALEPRAKSLLLSAKFLHSTIRSFQDEYDNQISIISNL